MFTLILQLFCNNCPCNLSGYYRLHRIHQIKKLSICLWCASVSLHTPHTPRSTTVVTLPERIVPFSSVKEESTATQWKSSCAFVTTQWNSSVLESIHLVWTHLCELILWNYLVWNYLVCDQSMKIILCCVTHHWKSSCAFVITQWNSVVLCCDNGR